jgi:hypothetical protein
MSEFKSKQAFNMDKRLDTVVSNLLTGTDNRQLKWEPSERKTEYRLRLSHGLVAVDSWEINDEFGSEEDNYVDITFFNSEGLQVDRYAFSKSSEREDYNIIYKLHDAARRNYLKVDETLSGLFKEISEKAKM